MKPVKYDEVKNNWLKEKRGISFEEIIKAITKGEIVTIINNPNRKKYPTQKIYLIKLKNYIYSVPFVEEKEYFFLKTIIPSRKQTKKYLKGYKLINIK